MDKLRRSIQQTLEYGRKFGVEYSGRDIKERLISSIVYKDNEIETTTEKLGVRNEELGMRRKSIYKSKVNKAKVLADRIGRKFRDILFIGVTGSVAAGYPKNSDDIDLMIVTRRNRLWLNRLLMRIYVAIGQIPHRRYGRIEKADEFCFNLWMEEDELLLPRNKQTLKNAMDSILMIPVLNKEEIYEKFMTDNIWIKRWVATAYKKLVTSNWKPEKSKINTNIVFDLLNWLVYWPQWWYMRNKLGKGLVDIKRAFFHPSDRIRYAK